MTLTKANIVEAVAEQTGYPKNQSFEMCLQKQKIKISNILLRNLFNKRDKNSINTSMLSPIP